MDTPVHVARDLTMPDQVVLGTVGDRHKLPCM
jgi:hypothetical protein